MHRPTRIQQHCHSRFSSVAVYCSLVLLLLVGSVALAQSPIAGTWKGTLLPQSQNLTLIYRITEEASGLGGTMAVPAQGASGLALEAVRFEDGVLSMAFDVPGGGAFEGRIAEDGRSIEGVFRQGGAEIPLTLERGTDESVAALHEPARPQEPTGEPPYRSEEVSISSADNVLAGTLTWPPEGAGSGIGVVLVAGAGPQDRDGTMMGHRPLLVLADRLTRRGLATLRVDEAGVGSSTGDAAKATPVSQARDLHAAAQLLAARDGVTRVGIVAHSEGALPALEVMDAMPEIEFAILLGPPALPGIDALRMRAETAATGPLTGAGVQARIVHAMAAGMLATDADEADEADQAELVEAGRSELAQLPEAAREQLETVFSEETLRAIAIQLDRPWNRATLEEDPRERLRALDRPILALYGAADQVLDLDVQVPAMRSALNGELGAVEVLDGLNHFFQEVGPTPRSVAEIEQTMSPIVWQRIGDFLESVND